MRRGLCVVSPLSAMISDVHQDKESETQMVNFCRRSPVGRAGRRSDGPYCGTHPLQVTQMRAPTRERLQIFVGARQLVRGHRPAGVAPSGPMGGHTPVLAHQLASARKFFSGSERTVCSSTSASSSAATSTQYVSCDPVTAVTSTSETVRACPPHLRKSQPLSPVRNRNPTPVYPSVPACNENRKFVLSDLLDRTRSNLLGIGVTVARLTLDQLV